MPGYWEGTRVVVTGGRGFIGSHVVDRLVAARGVAPAAVTALGKEDGDLTELDNALRVMAGADVVLHLASLTGGLGYSAHRGASQYLASSLIDLHVLEAARQLHVKKFVAVACSTAYPERAVSPLSEEALFDGPIARSHIGSGTAKRNLVTAVQLYHQDFGLGACALIANNAYGPRDSFDSERAHVIPATIRKCFEVGDLQVWGDGTALRDFLYVEDLAEAILLAAESLPAGEFVNIGSGEESTIRELVELIAHLAGFEGRISFDTTRPTGDHRRSVAIAKAQRLLGFRASVDLEEGLRRTINWYRASRQPERAR